MATVFPFSSFPSPLREGLFYYIEAILILHLLIVWDLTWVPVPLDTLFGFLWIVIAKVALFRGLLHINVARRVIVAHLMWW